ncbi:MAG: hypothetical protein K2F83_02575, partial [Oscillospiraceae bacterium]|nr:hypothetical protein [Oscillospiraceae bacterium]
MSLSVLPTGMVTASATVDAKAANAISRPLQDLEGDDILKSKQDSASQEAVPMPLQLSVSQIGFSESLLENEVTAYMTDLQYLNLTLEEYASFFPAWVDLDRVDYLTYQLRQAIKEMKETQRMSYRAAAEAKLDLQSQFIWEATYDGQDYSDKLAFEPQSWTIYEATESRAPMLVCTATVRWIGKIPTVTSTSGANGEMNQLLNQINNSGSNAEATKDISQESPEIQEFLWELYKTGLVQSNAGGYDLSVFEERAKAEGLTITPTETGVDLDKLLDDLHNPGTEEDETSEGEGTTPVDTGFNMLTGNGSGSAQSQEPAEQTTGTQAGTDGTVESDSGDSADDANKESAEEAESAGQDAENEELNGEDADNENEVVVPESDVPQAPAPENEEGEGKSAEPEASDEHNHDDDEFTIPEGTDIAYYKVSMKNNENIFTYGTAVCFGNAISQLNNNNDDDNKPDDKDNNEPTPASDTDPSKTDEDALTMEEKMAAVTGSFNGRHQGPNVAANRVYHIRLFSEKRLSDGTLTAETYNIVPVMQRLLQDAANNAGYTLQSIDVLDHRVAVYDEESKQLVVTGEGRTAVYASARRDSNGAVIYAVAELEVRGLYHLSSEDPDELDPKQAVPMISAGQSHTLALTSAGEVYGWGDGNGGALGAQNKSLQYSPQPITIKQENGNYTTLTGIVSVAAGDNFSLALTKDGRVYAWGDNQQGQLGVVSSLGTGNTQITEPSLVLAPRDASDPNRDEDGYLNNIVAISAGVNHSLALTADGAVYAWGKASNGQLGQGGSITHGGYIAVPVPVKSGTSSEEGENRLSGVIAITAGADFSLALTAEGRVYSWGDNRRGQLGTNQAHTTVENRNYAVLVSGKRDYEQTNGSTDFVGVLAISAWGLSPADATASTGHALAITAVVDNDRKLTGETKIYAWGENQHSEIGGNVSGGTDVILPSGVGFSEDFETHGLRAVAVAAGGQHSLAIVRLIDEEATLAAFSEYMNLLTLDELDSDEEDKSETDQTEPEETEGPENKDEAENKDDETENDDEAENKDNETESKDEIENKDDDTESKDEAENKDETEGKDETENGFEDADENENQDENVTETENKDEAENEDESAEESTPEDGVTNDVDIATVALSDDVTTSVTTDVTEQNEDSETEESQEQNESENKDDSDIIENQNQDEKENSDEAANEENGQDENGAVSEDQNENADQTENETEKETEDTDTDKTTDEDEKETEDNTENKNKNENDGLNGENGNANGWQEAPGIMDDDMMFPADGAYGDNDLNAIAEGDEDEGDQEPDYLRYKYYIYGWGFDELGALAQGSHAVTEATQAHPVPLLLNKSVDGEGKELKEPVENPGGISAGWSFSVYWFYDGTVDNLENGTVMATGWNSTAQLGAKEALAEKGIVAGDGSTESSRQWLPLRVGAGVSKQLIFNKIWVFTTEEDPDTGIVTKSLTARYSAQPASMMDEDVDQLILASLGQEDFDLNLLPVNKLSDMLPITDRQEILIFKSGIRRYYDVGFNIFERDRAVATPEGVDINYDVETEPDDAAYLNLTDTDDKHISGRNNAYILPGDNSVEKQFGTTKFNAREDLPEDERYSGYLHIQVKDADNFTTPDIQAGEGFMVALKSDGSVWAWGDNSKGQLGIGSTKEQVPYTTYPTPVSGLMGNGRLNLIEEISVGYDHVLARTADGSVYSWGSNEHGQLGLGDTFVDTCSYVPRQVIAGDSEMFSPGAVYLGGATAIAAGGYHSMALLNTGDGFVYSWG